MNTVRTTARRAQTRAHILDAARTLIIKGGMEAMSLRAVADKAGYSPAALYEYFDGREAIVRALSEATMSRLGEALAATPPTRSALKRLVALGLAYIDFALTHSEDFLLAFTRFESTRQSEAEAVPPNSPYAVLADAVKSALESGELAKGTVDTIAYALWAQAHGLAMLRLTHLRKFDADFSSADKRALTALVSGLKS